jgi:hypothetical protein
MMIKRYISKKISEGITTLKELSKEFESPESESDSLYIGRKQQNN